MKKDGLPQALAAAKSGMCEKTGRKYLKAGRLPSQMKSRRSWRTREDPFSDDWCEIVQLLESDETLEVKSIFEYLCRKYPGKYQEGQIRTLQRHVKKWKVRKGPPKEVVFAQDHPPGDQAQSDFTNMNKMGITINGQPFPHLLYHFVLTYSNWEWVTICQSESFEALSMGVQSALWQLGAVPIRHKTDNLSAAVKDLKSVKDFTESYMDLMAHYGMTMSRNSPGKAQENGDVEQSHRQLMRGLRTEFLIRGNRDFENVDAYRSFLEKVAHRRNRGRSKRFAKELEVMRELPPRRLDDYTIEEVRVTQYSTIHVRRNIYSVSSRLIGESLRVHIYGDHLALWHGGYHLVDLPRLRGRGKVAINYRHIIDSLIKKPGAFENYKYQSSLFPSLVFRSTYDWLSQNGAPKADREYLRILHLAAKEGERSVEQACRNLLYAGQPISAEELKVILTQGQQPAKATVTQVALTAYDQLLAEVPCGRA